MDRRAFIAAAVASAAAQARPFGGGSSGGGGGTTFDFYVSPTGDDNNTGTLGSPWSITALNSKQSSYAGKRVGFLPGTYTHGTVGGVQTTLYSLVQTPVNGSQTEALSVQGGASAGAVTYLGASNSSGNSYTRTGSTVSTDLPIIDCSNPSGGALPTTEAYVFGQVFGHAAPNVSQYGNLTIDGLVIRNFSFSAILILPHAASSFVANNVIIKNCEIYNGVSQSGSNNPGAIWVQWAGVDSSGNIIGTGAFQATNNLIHDLSVNDPTQTRSHMAIITFKSASVITNCTTYNCGALSSKDGWQWMNVSYCYLGFGGVLGAGNYSGTDTSNPSGTVVNYLTSAGNTIQFHHNILTGWMASYGESASQSNLGTVQIYHNTFYKPGSVGGSNLGLGMWYDDEGTSGGGPPYGTFEFNDNLVYAADGNYTGALTGTGCSLAKKGASSGGTFSTISATDHNAYGSGMSFGDPGTLALTAWKALGFGWDTNSISLASNPFTGTPTEPDYTTFAISGPAATASSTGGPCGAVDGSGAIGASFWQGAL